MSERDNYPEIRNALSVVAWSEVRIKNGDQYFLLETDRQRLKEVLKDVAVIDLDVLQKERIVLKSGQVVTLEDCDKGHGVGTLSAQTAYLMEALGGEERAIPVINRLFLSVMADDGFVMEYFDDPKHKDGDLIKFDTGKERKKCHLEAIISAAHRFLLIVGEPGVSNGAKQKDKYTLKFLRERILRGFEKRGGQPSPYTERVVKDKIIRSLPVGALEKVVRQLMFPE